ncbi:hypothetical protein EKE94_03855 [Mesobaculum littorinae]|uniref:C4-dicarboxylate ABC transporter substrate-binding protein n=1 Tax=Mesobaculum littorinae TaxID=2486419 RepID=A0A438AMP5_9RHOB|nr:C4-dicarboxylate TRAP transporter substrate-binding protein [Mesobaculum littorinae]RVV99816.1 hypothetical protein EKE94_03855 [Mesobaculum littorinae]
MRHTKLLTAASAAALLAAAPVAAKDLVYGSWLGSNNATNTNALQPYFDMVREATDGEINWEMVSGAQLANGPATPEAVGANMMDGGIVMAPYQPRMLPATNMLFSQSLIGDDFIAATGAMNEVMMLGCPACQEEYERNDAVGFAGYSVSPYLFMCRDDVETMEDLQSKKIRASGGGVGIVELMGATPVSMPPSDATSALERGTIDCVLGSVQWLRSFGYMDVTDTVVEAPMGMGGPPIMMYVNRGVWEDMTPEQRQAHIDLAPDLVAMETFDAQLAEDESAVAEAKERGITFVEGGQPFDDLMARHDERQYQRNADAARDAGVEDPEALIDAYLAAYEKWKGISEEIGRDRDAFRDALDREIYSKVDPDEM